MVGDKDRGRQRAAHVWSLVGRDESELYSKYIGKAAEKFSQGEELTLRKNNKIFLLVMWETFFQRAKENGGGPIKKQWLKSGQEVLLASEDSGQC